MKKVLVEMRLIMRGIQDDRSTDNFSFRSTSQIESLSFRYAHSAMLLVHEEERFFQDLRIYLPV